MSLAAAMSRIKRLESSLDLAYEMLREKGEITTERDKTIADQQSASNEQQRIINQQGQTLTERDGKIAQLEHTINKQQRALDKQERTIARSSGHASRIEDHLQQAITIAGFIAVAPNGAAMHNGAAPRNTDTDDETWGSDDTRDDNSALDGADRDGDDYAHVTVHTDTVPHSVAMGGASPGGTSSRGSSPGGIFLHSAYPAGASSRSTSLGGASPGGAAPYNDAARAISGLRARAPADEIPLSSRAFKRPRPNQRVCDGAGQVVTTEDLLGVFGTIAFVDISTLASVYELAVNRPLFPTGVEPQRFAQELAGLEGFSHWKPRFALTGSASLNGLSLLRRDNRELELLRPRVLQQLGLAQDSGAVVLSPRLYYVMFSMVAIPLERITGRVLEKVFTTLTTKKLATLKVVTRNGVRNMSPDELCVLAKAWLRKLRRFTRGAGGFRHLRESANSCNANYTRLCSERGGDHTGNIAKGMLDGSSECRLLLGLTDAHDLEVLCTRFESAGNDNDESQADRLREIADEVNNQPE
ncbi:hypothetical protein LPJ71_001724 [Coemansia sp. S17]|nr:hypothetical protein LPJ71_001724 [Coemansia sp. S17]